MLVAQAQIEGLPILTADPAIFTVTGLAERGLSQEEIDMITGESYLRMLERARPTQA